VASLSQGRTAAAQCGLFTHKSVPVIFEPPCTIRILTSTACRRCGLRWSNTNQEKTEWCWASCFVFLTEY